jgi:competence protein ComEC
VAVAGILLWAMPLYRLCATRFKLLNAILGILWVGVASTLITMPLVANTFSVVSLLGILINPIVILLANIIVLAGIVALVVPIVGVVAELAAEVQNGVVAWAESLPYGHFEITISDSAMWGVYALFVVATIVGISLFGGEKKREIEI